MSRKAKLSVWMVLCLILCLAANVAHAGDKEDIVGRWDHPLGDRHYIRFYEDGTFKEVAPLNSVEGKFRFLSKEVIEFDTPGVFYGRDKMEVKYRLDGDTLELKIDGKWTKYSRVK